MRNKDDRLYQVTSAMVCVPAKVLEQLKQGEEGGVGDFETTFFQKQEPKVCLDLSGYFWALSTYEN